MQEQDNPLIYQTSSLPSLTSKLNHGRIHVEIDTFDKHSIVNNFLFAHEVNVLADENNGTLPRKNSTQLLLGVHVRRHFPWLQKLLQRLPRSIGKYFMPAAVKDAMALRKVSS